MIGTPTHVILLQPRQAEQGKIGSYKPHMREVDLVPLFDHQSSRPRSTRIIVDSKSACLAEAGELYHLQEHLPQAFGEDDELLVELGSLVDREGRIKDGSQGDEEEVVVL